MGPFELSWNTPGEKMISLSVSGNGCDSEINSQLIQIEAPLAEPIISCSPSSNSIIFTWSTIEGASGYLVNGIQQSNTSFTADNLTSGESFTLSVTALGMAFVQIVLLK